MMPAVTAPPPEDLDRLRRRIDAALADFDFEAAKQSGHLSPAQRAERGLAMMEAAERAGVAELHRHQPELTPHDALLIYRAGILFHRRGPYTWLYARYRYEDKLIDAVHRYSRITHHKHELFDMAAAVNMAGPDFDWLYAWDWLQLLRLLEEWAKATAQLERLNV